MSALTYRGITIQSYDIPDSPLIWIDHESDTRGEAADLDEAKLQIGWHLGPAGNATYCPRCDGDGQDDASGLERCRACGGWRKPSHD